MKVVNFIKYFWFGLTTVILKRKKPLIGSIIITDKCNLHCKHCSVSNINSLIYPFDTIKSDMEELYLQGVRILFFYGGEPFLWRDKGFTLKDLVCEARKIGFHMVNIVTNGTLPLDMPMADLIMVSVDGSRDKHNIIRGDTYDLIMKNIMEAPEDNICLFMAVNNINLGDMEDVCNTALKLKNVKAVSFNLHTPYPGTEYLSLCRAEKQRCLDCIEKLMDNGYPVLNLRTAFPYILDNSFKTPCLQCVIRENGQQWVCGRCVDIEGLCHHCGFLFAAEYSLVFTGNFKVICDMVRTYIKYI